MTRHGVLLVLLALVATASARLEAHNSPASHVELRREGHVLSVDIDLGLAALEAELSLDADHDGHLRWAEVEAARSAIQAVAIRRLKINADATPCRPTAWRPLSLADRQAGRYLRLSVELDCGAQPRTLALDGRAWFDELPDQQVFVNLTDFDGGIAVLTRGAPTLSVSATSPPVAWRFFTLGIGHLLGGADHLAFLMLLLIGAVKLGAASGGGLRRPLLQALKVVTAFTVAHSLTLALAATGVLRLPAALVEAAIAATIVITAIAVAWPGARWHGWPIAFGFGLVHGIGFARVLSELVSGAKIVIPLLAFNLGIEAAQLCIVALILPCLWAFARSPQALRVAAPAMAGGIGVLATVWLVQRLP